MRAGPTISSREKSNPAVSNNEALGLVDAVIEIGRERQRIMETMRAALLRGDDDEALERVRELTGLLSNQPTVSSIAK